MKGVNRGIQICRSLPFFGQVCWSANTFWSNLKPQPHPEREVQKFKDKLVNVNVIVNSIQLVKKATPLSLTNSLVYPQRLKKYLWSKFHPGPKIWASRQAQSGSRDKIHSSSTIHYIFKIRPSARIYHTNPQSVQFLRRNLSIRKPI